MDGSLIAAIIAAVVALLCGIFTYRSSIRSSTIESRKVDQTAYDRAIEYYSTQLDRVTGQVDRLNVVLDKVSSQLASEQDVSNTLRNQVRDLQRQVDLLSHTISDLRTRPFDQPDAAKKGQ